MRYLSVCSGIEAATVAWQPLGWKAAGFAEIDKFPSAVLDQHYQNVPNFGDFTTIQAHDVGSIDLLVGGTPCQSFSIAGLRGGLDDDRGNLALEFLRLAQRTRPEWLVWENVDGVFSSLSHTAPDPCPPPPPVDLGCNGAEVESTDEYYAEEVHAFNSFLAGLSEIGYGFAYRVLDAQYFGLAQRRKRVFVVGYLGDWRPAAAVLLERESLSWNSPPRRKARENIAPTISARTKGGGGLGTDFDCDGGLIAPPLTRNPYGDHESREGLLVPSTGNVAHCLNAGGMGRIDYESETLITHALRGEGFDASEDDTGRGTPLVPVPIQSVQSVREKRQNGIGIGDAGDAMYTLTGRDSHGVAFLCKDHGADAGEIAPTLRAMGHDGSHANAGGQLAVAFHENQRGELTINDTAGSLKVGGGKPGQGYPAVKSGSSVRRLTPRECERLQGFPDDYTLIPYRNGWAADGPRYKALGNSMAVPVMAWIGKQIDRVTAILSTQQGGNAND